MHYIDWLLIDWVFWPVEVIFFAVLYYALPKNRKSEYEAADQFSGAGLFWTVAILGFLWWKWRELPTWQHALEGLLAYAAIGFFISLYRYWVVLVEFKDEAPDLLAKNAHRGFDTNDGSKDKENTTKWLCVEFGYYRESVKWNAADKAYVINWRAFPVGIWWTYWPCFLFSSIFEFAEKIQKALMNLMRHFYENLAHRFRVQGGLSQEERAK
jgi:hypothetical protein